MGYVSNMRPPKKGLIFVFSAASGGGKTTLLNYLKVIFPDLIYSISVTTRLPRIGEVNGDQYFFISNNEFKRKIAAGEFAEWAFVHDYFYGTPKKFIDETIASGRHIIMDIDVFGKKKFDEIYPNAIGIMVLPPSLKDLEQRLRNRNTDTEETIKLRLINAQKEMDFAHNYGKYEYTVINDDLEKTKAAVADIVRNSIAAA